MEGKTWSHFLSWLPSHPTNYGLISVCFDFHLDTIKDDILPHLCRCRRALVHHFWHLTGDFCFLKKKTKKRILLIKLFLSADDLIGAQGRGIEQFAGSRRSCNSFFPAK